MRASLRVPADPEGYELIEPFDRGATSLVWRARHRSTGTVRLVSLLPAVDDPAPLARIEREAQLLTKLPDISVAEFVEIVPHESGWALVTEHGVERTLNDFVDEHGPVPPEHAVAALEPIAEALAATHQVKLVHGEVSDVTVLVTADGSCVVGEYGVSRYLRDSNRSSDSSSSPMAAPEVRRDERAVPATDVYGFGRVLLFLLSGDVSVTDPLDLLSATTAKPSAALVALVGRCLADDLHDRPADGLELVDLLAETPEHSAAQGGLDAFVCTSRLQSSRAGVAESGQSRSERWRPRPPGAARVGTLAAGLIVLIALAFALFGSPPAIEDSGEPDTVLLRE